MLRSWIQLKYQAQPLLLAECKLPLVDSNQYVAQAHSRSASVERSEHLARTAELTRTPVAGQANSFAQEDIPEQRTRLVAQTFARARLDIEPPEHKTA